MDTVLMIVTYVISWFIVLGMAFLVLGHLVHYVGLEQRSAKALLGLILVGILLLAAALGLTIAQMYSIDLAKKGVLITLLFESMLIQSINQWTIATMQKPIQRILRWMITSLTIVMGLVVVGFFIFVHL